ncbi:MAG: hypothetical protein M1826_005336 [Phylliscum demangeonii]|nr:MAG: hypothetical protein M1826_005336 [Phylliscum demangeonii]
MGSATARPFMAGPNREAERRRGEREDAAAREVGSWWRGRGCFGQKARFQKGGREARHRRRCWVGVMLAALLVLIALVTALAVGLRPKTKRAIPTEASPWVNITGWPPLPTGVSSIVRPDAVKANSGCVFPSTMWSCSLPKEVQGGSGAAPADQPEFRFEIRYPSNTTSSPPASDTSSVFPEPPSVEEQQFMGNTTDGIASPLKEGEASPFFMALLSNPVSSSSSSPRRKRSHDTPRTKRDDGSFPVPLLGIPPPDIDADGSVKAANLLPLSVSQRLRLYDRGLDSEHYGFYIYYDRSIFLQSTALLNQSDRGQGSVPADRDGGSPARDARVRCTWAQTRFLVQVWTRMNQTRVEGNEPASFVYPATITLDRHGGDVTKKLIYCYGLDPAAPTHIVPRAVKIQVENRGFGGQLVGGGQGPLGKDRVTRAQGGLGGIDGGTGGCACAWKNFRG